MGCCLWSPPLETAASSHCPSLCSFVLHHPGARGDNIPSFWILQSSTSSWNAVFKDSWGTRKEGVLGTVAPGCGGNSKIGVKKRFWATGCHSPKSTTKGHCLTSPHCRTSHNWLDVNVIALLCTLSALSILKGSMWGARPLQNLIGENIVRLQEVCYLVLRAALEISIYYY